MDTARGWRWSLTPWVLIGVYLAIAFPLILSGTLTGRWGEDQLNFHEPAIRTFAAELPRPNVQDYRSATTPGYHLVVAALSKVLGSSVAALQLIGTVFTVALLGLLGWTCAGYARSRIGSERKNPPRTLEWLVPIAVGLPVVASMYVLQSGVWLLPDNAGWLGVLAMLVLALRYRVDTTTLALAALALVGLVLVRQIHIWTAGLLWMGAWLSPPWGERAGAERGRVLGGELESNLHPFSLAPLLADVPRRLKATALAVLVTVPAFVVLGYFYREWNGLTPPSFQGQYKGMNAAAPAFILSVFGVASFFFVPFIVDGLAMLATRRRGVLAIAVILGAVVAVVPATSYSVEAGRFSGLWALSSKLPLIAGRTAPAIVCLSVLGAVMLAAWALSLRLRDRWMLLAAFAGFMLAQAASFQLWQRYSEPFVLMVLAVMACRA